MATITPSTANEIVGLLAHVIADVAGGTEPDRKKRITIERVPTCRFARRIWFLETSGTAA